MQISARKTYKQLLNNHQGFSLIEILVALLLAAMVFLAVPSGDSAQKHRELRTAVDNIDRSVRFAANEAILRNTVVRLRISLDKEPLEYTVEYGPAGNLPLPETNVKTSLSLEAEKALLEKRTSLDKQFTKVEEFEEIKHSIHEDVSINGVASSSQGKLMNRGEAVIYFYPTGEKDGALVFFSTVEEMAYLEVEPFLSETHTIYETFKKERVAKVEDIVQTRMDEVFKEWSNR